MSKFKVGDRVRFIDNGGYDLNERQQVGEVVGKYNTSVYKVKVDNYGRPLAFHEVELIPESSAQSSEILTRIAAIETELTALKSLVQPVEPPPTGSAARKAVIERARAFVAKYSGIVRKGTTPYTTEVGDVRAEFVVNAEKRTVVALGHLAHTGGMYKKGIAKCAPGDVFNADIGKAIAVGRLYGVDVPEEFLDAPKPDEPVAGQLVQSIARHSGRIRFTHRVLEGENTDGIRSALVGDEQHAYATIIDDTEAQY